MTEFPVRQVGLPDVVGEIDSNTPGGEIGKGQIFRWIGVRVPNEEGLELEVLVPEQFSGLIVEVHACGVAVLGLESFRVSGGGPSCVDGSDGGLGEDRPFHPGHGEVLYGDGSVLVGQFLGSGPYLEKPQFVPSGLAAEAGPVRDGYGFPSLQPDSATEVRRRAARKQQI